MSQIDINRRRVLALGGAALGAAVLPKAALAALSTPSASSLTASSMLITDRPRVLQLYNLHTGESLKAEFSDGKNYITEELARLNHFFRDFRANEIEAIDPHLFDHIYRLQGALETDKTIQLVSGFRSPQTNAKLRGDGKKSGVAKHSMHMVGRAMDFHIDGVDLKHVHKAALALSMGGVGYYPKSNFVHIDTGAVRQWQML